MNLNIFCIPIDFQLFPPRAVRISCMAVSENKVLHYDCDHSDKAINHLHQMDVFVEWGNFNTFMCILSKKACLK